MINKKGFTLVEVMVTTAIMAIILPVLVVVFMSTNKGFISFEASNSLKQANQNSVNRIYVRLGRNKRLFEETVADLAFLARADLSGCASVLMGSKLPVIKTTGSFSPSSPDFDTLSFGNSLFFAYHIAPAVLENIITNAAATESQTVKIDLYRFIYYYLSPDTAPVFLGYQSYKLNEWESVKYASCSQINAITNTIKKSNTVAALISDGVNYCVDTPQTDVLNAFYRLEISAGAGQLSLDNSHTIAQSSCKLLTKTITALLGRGYSYGVSPNTSGFTSVRNPVPAFATASGFFPSGFEVAVTGLSAGRKVLVRSVLMAQTGSNSFVASEMPVISSARDLW